jgi:hypothetical protein
MNSRMEADGPSTAEKSATIIRFRRSYRLVGFLRVAFSHRGNKTSSGIGNKCGCIGADQIREYRESELPPEGARRNRKIALQPNYQIRSMFLEPVQKLGGSSQEQVRECDMDHGLSGCVA